MASVKGVLYYNIQLTYTYDHRLERIGPLTKSSTTNSSPSRRGSAFYVGYLRYLNHEGPQNLHFLGTRSFERSPPALSLFCLNRSKFSSKRIALSANAFSAVLASFWIFSLQWPSSSPLCAMLSSICLHKDIKLSNVVGVSGGWNCGGSQCLSTAVGRGSTRASGFWMSFSTLLD